MKRINIFLLVLSISFQVFSQDEILTVEDANFINPALYPVRVSQLNWMESAEFYTYEKENTIFLVSAK